MQFIFNPDKTSLVGVTCCAHRFSYFINNVNTEKSFMMVQNSSLVAKKHLLPITSHHHP